MLMVCQRFTNVVLFVAGPNAVRLHAGDDPASKDNTFVNVVIPVHTQTQEDAFFTNYTLSSHDTTIQFNLSVAPLISALKEAADRQVTLRITRIPGTSQPALRAHYRVSDSMRAEFTFPITMLAAEHFEARGRVDLIAYELRRPLTFELPPVADLAAALEPLAQVGAAVELAASTSGDVTFSAELSESGAGTAALRLRGLNVRVTSREMLRIVERAARLDIRSAATRAAARAARAQRRRERAGAGTGAGDADDDDDNDDELTEDEEVDEAKDEAEAAADAAAECAHGCDVQPPREARVLVQSQRLSAAMLGRLIEPVNAYVVVAPNVLVFTFAGGGGEVMLHVPLQARPDF
jgi:hypothetical protein